MRLDHPEVGRLGWACVWWVGWKGGAVAQSTVGMTAFRACTDRQTDRQGRVSATGSKTKKI